MRFTKNHFLKIFAACVLLLALIRVVFPSVAEPQAKEPNTEERETTADAEESAAAQRASQPVRLTVGNTKFVKPDGSLIKNRIRSVPSYAQAFPDLNDVQLEVANKYGVKPVADREEAENRKTELVYMASSPYYHVDKLNNSVPYLVPRAAVLLNDIGRNFFDSLQIKGIPLHKFIVTSVLRSEADVKKLRGHNGNASENSCHRFGTTFDIAYNRYKTVEAPDGPARRQVRNDTLKWVMSEVLNDLRQNNRCYIKYEVKQGCFHVTVR